MKPPYANSDPLDFTPVPRGLERHGGWTAEAQRAFIDALADCASVNGAAQRVGKTASTAYRLRASAGAASFAAAWDAARQMGISQLEDVAMDRAIKGVEVPVFHKGERVGERRWFDNRLLMSMLRHNRSRRYGPKFAEFDLIETAVKEHHAKQQERYGLLDRLTSQRDALEMNLVTVRDVKEEAELEPGGLEPGWLELLEADLADTAKKLAQVKIWIAQIEKEIADEPEPVWRQIGRS